MKKWFLILLALAMVAMTLSAVAEAPLTDQNIAENIEAAPASDQSALDNIPVVGQLVGEDGVIEVEEWVDLDEEESDEPEWPEEDDEGVEVEDVDVEEEILEWVDLDEGNLTFPEVYCEVLEDTFELAEPAEGAQIVGGHYKGEQLSVVDITGDYWMLQGGTYVSADAVKLANECDIPGECEAITVMNPRSPFNVRTVLSPIASDIDDVVATYHSVIIVDPYEKLIRCYKLGVSTLDVRMEPLDELSQLYAYWSIDEDFLQEGEYLIGWEEVLAKIYAYSLPGSYLVIYQ
jgi:hypothetical protein